MSSSINFDHQEDLRQRLSQASRRFQRMLTPPRQGSGDQGDSSVHHRRNVIHNDSDVQENQGAGVGIIESLQRDSESTDHSQQPPPPQNQEPTSQWRSFGRGQMGTGQKGTRKCAILHAICGNCVAILERLRNCDAITKLQCNG